MSSFPGITIAIIAIAGIQWATLDKAVAIPTTQPVNSLRLALLSESDLLQSSTDADDPISVILRDYQPPDDTDAPDSSQGSGTR